MKQILLIPGLALWMSCGSPSTEPDKSATQRVTVQLMKAGGNINEGVTVSGKIEAEQTAGISTRLMGTITRIYVKVGDHIRAGQLLATVQANDISAKKSQANAAIAEASAHLASAQKDFDRFTQLYSKKSASAKELDNATLQYNAAKARLEAANQMKAEAEALLGYASLVAPFSGTVTQKMLDEGAMASPGMPLLMIEGDGRLTVTAFVSEEVIGLIQKGDPAEVTVKATGNKVNCTVGEISRSSTFTGGQYQVKLPVAAAHQKDLYAGMNVSVTIQPGKEKKAEDVQQIVVPSSSLIQQDQLTGLYTVSSSQTAMLRWIRVGKTYGDQVEVLSGIGKGESFIFKAEGRLYNGAPVVVK